jgi:hypothetical protein
MKASFSLFFLARAARASLSASLGVGMKGRSSRTLSSASAGLSA